jgi:hypothetical protein
LGVEHDQAPRFGRAEIRKANEIARRTNRLVGTRVNAVDSDTGNIYGMVKSATHFIASDPIVYE